MAMGSGLRGAEQGLEDERVYWRLVQVHLCQSSGQEQEGEGGEGRSCDKTMCQAPPEGLVCSGPRSLHPIFFFFFFNVHTCVQAAWEREKKALC